MRPQQAPPSWREHQDGVLGTQSSAHRALRLCQRLPACGPREGGDPPGHREGDSGTPALLSHPGSILGIRPVTLRHLLQPPQRGHLATPGTREAAVTATPSSCGLPPSGICHRGAVTTRVHRGGQGNRLPDVPPSVDAQCWHCRWGGGGRALAASRGWMWLHPAGPASGAWPPGLSAALGSTLSLGSRVRE